MDRIVERMSELGEHALPIWKAGGWAMLAIAFIALVMFAVGVHVFLRLQATGFQSLPERKWRRWLAEPSERTGPIGEHLDHVAGARTIEEMSRAFQEVRTAEIAPYQRDLRVMKVCIGAAPLFGLLGTVTGMLATFGALATGSGGDQTMAQIAAGISEALITTETGLVIALPGLFFHYQLTRKYERYKAFLAHLETVTTQALHRQIASEGQARVEMLVDSPADWVGDESTPVAIEAAASPARARFNRNEQPAAVGLD